MKPNGATYTVVEFAGMNNEQDVCTFTSADKAYRFVERQYDEQDREKINPMVRRNAINGEREYV